MFQDCSLCFSATQLNLRGFQKKISQKHNISMFFEQNVEFAQYTAIQSTISLDLKRSESGAPRMKPDPEHICSKKSKLSFFSTKLFFETLSNLILLRKNRANSPETSSGAI